MSDLRKDTFQLRTYEQDESRMFAIHCTHRGIIAQLQFHFENDFNLGLKRFENLCLGKKGANDSL